jgi:hypothetical protein
VTGDVPAEIGVAGDSTTGDRSSCGSSSISSSYSNAPDADSIVVAESLDFRLSARLARRDLRLCVELFLSPELPFRMRSKYVLGGGSTLGMLLLLPGGSTIDCGALKFEYTLGDMVIPLAVDLSLNTIGEPSLACVALVGGASVCDAPSTGDSGWASTALSDFVLLKRLGTSSSAAWDLRFWLPRIQLPHLSAT